VVHVATLTRTVTALNDTVFGDTANTFTAGLEDNECTLTLFLSYASAATYATLAPLVGTKTTVIVKPTDAVDSATNPGFTLTNCYLRSVASHLGIPRRTCSKSTSRSTWAAFTQQT
jgi:hypothetical protein